MSETRAAPVSEELLRGLLARAGIRVTKVVVSGHDIVISGSVDKMRPKATRAAAFHGKVQEPEARVDVILTGKELEAPLPGMPRLDPAALAAAGSGSLSVATASELPADVLALFRQRSAPPNTETATVPSYDPLNAFRTS